MREKERSPETRGRTVRIPGVTLLAERTARKIRIEDPHGGPPLEIVLVRLDGRLYALDTLCPHEGGRFVEGPLWDDRYVICPLHLYRFDPRDGHAIEVECASARTFPVREVDGTAEVWIPEGQSPGAMGE